MGNTLHKLLEDKDVCVFILSDSLAGYEILKLHSVDIAQVFGFFFVFFFLSDELWYRVKGNQLVGFFFLFIREICYFLLVL